MVLSMTPAYLKSKWCQQELAAFSGAVQDAELLDGIENVLNRNQVFYDAGEIEDLEKELKYVFDNCNWLIIATFPYSLNSCRLCWTPQSEQMTADSLSQRFETAKASSGPTA